MSKKKTLIIILSACAIVLILLVYITWQAVIETENWNWFDIDYTNQDKVITSYGALLAAILSTFSIILLVYTIYLQMRESKKQSKRFKKEYSLQKEQFDAEKKREERKEKQDLYYKLKLISVFLESIIKHIEETSVEIKKFIVAEKENPLGMNMLYFLVNKNMSKLIEMDYLAIFIAFKEFLQTEENWTKNFNNLFSLVGFYKDALDEVRDNYKYHSKDKYLRKNQIADDLKLIMDEAARIAEKYKIEYIDETNLSEPFKSLIEDFIAQYYAFLDKNNETQLETNFDELSQGLLQDFLKNAMIIRREIGFGPFGVEELVISVSSIRKKIYKLKFDSLYFANDLKNRYNDYFSPNSVQLKKLKELKKYIDKQLAKINTDEL